MRILYSFNKKGAEAEFWKKEINDASTSETEFIAFNHCHYLNPNLYLRAQRLDDLYFDQHPGLFRLYADLEAKIRDENIDVVVVDNFSPYHPDWLRKLPVFKVLRVNDGPMTAYDRDFAYAHAYDLVLYHSPAYSRDMGMEEKLNYIGAKNTTFWPLGVFDATFNPTMSEDELFGLERDIDVVFVGAMYPGKMPLLAKVKKAFGNRCEMHGLTSLKKNLYFNARYGFPGWISPIPQSQYMPLYQRAKIGFNVHNRGKFTIGSFRLYELPANGVMQISDGDEYLKEFFNEGQEIIGYSNADDLIDKIRYYLKHEDERIKIARMGYQRAMRDYRIGVLLNRMANNIKVVYAQRNKT